jgi:hypothetical protein
MRLHHIISWSHTLPLLTTAQAVNLGAASTFGVLGASAVTNTGDTVIQGDLGISPGTAITGFPPGTFTGTLHNNDAVAAQAQADASTAYNVAAGLAPTQDLTGTDLGGRVLGAGVYSFSSAAELTGTLTLDAGGYVEAVFVFQIGSTLTTATSSAVALINGAQACNIIWQVGSSGTIGTATVFQGTILAFTSITSNTGSTYRGALIALNAAVTLQGNQVLVGEECVVGGGIGGVTTTATPSSTSIVGPPGTNVTTVPPTSTSIPGGETATTSVPGDEEGEGATTIPGEGTTTVPGEGETTPSPSTSTSRSRPPILGDTLGSSITDTSTTNTAPLTSINVSVPPNGPNTNPITSPTISPPLSSQTISTTTPITTPQSDSSQTTSTSVLNKITKTSFTTTSMTTSSGNGTTTTKPSKTRYTTITTTSCDVFTTSTYEKECSCYRMKELTSTRTYETVTVCPTVTASLRIAGEKEEGGVSAEGSQASGYPDQNEGIEASGGSEKEKGDANGTVLFTGAGSHLSVNGQVVLTLGLTVAWFMGFKM